MFPFGGILSHSKFPNQTAAFLSFSLRPSEYVPPSHRFQAHLPGGLHSNRHRCQSHAWIAHEYHHQSTCRFLSKKQELNRKKL